MPASLRLSHVMEQAIALGFDDNSAHTHRWLVCHRQSGRNSKMGLFPGWRRSSRKRRRNKPYCSSLSESDATRLSAIYIPDFQIVGFLVLSFYPAIWGVSQEFLQAGSAREWTNGATDPLDPWRDALERAQLMPEFWSGCVGSLFVKNTMIGIAAASHDNTGKWEAIGRLWSRCHCLRRSEER
jgi:hypothetical protein